MRIASTSAAPPATARSTRWSGASAALKLMDEHLAGRAFFVGERLSLADIALYAYTHVAHDAGLQLGRYPGIGAWLKRVAAEPGHVPIDA